MIIRIYRIACITELHVISENLKDSYSSVFPITLLNVSLSLFSSLSFFSSKPFVVLRILPFSHEASSNLARFDGVKYGYRAEKFDGIIDLYVKSRSEAFGQEVQRRIMLGTYVLSSGYYDAYYKKARAAQRAIRADYNKAFEQVDVIMTPVAPTTAYKIGEKTSDPLQMYMGDICTVSVNIAGLPAMVQPCGFDANKLPIGMQLIGPRFGEQKLINAGLAYEKASGLSNIVAL